MKKNYIVRVAVTVLVLTICSSYFVCNTLARYSWTGAALATTSVAKFSFNARIGNGAAGTYNFVNDNTEAANVDVFSTANSEYVQSGYLAPGVYGSFPVIIKNNSDVNIQITLSGTLALMRNGSIINNVTLPQIGFDDTQQGSYNKDFSAVVGTPFTVNMGAEYNRTVYWKWASSDTASALANDSPYTLVYVIRCTFTQVD